nr:hypothetical protein [uncultured Roseibium sp.]
MLTKFKLAGFDLFLRVLVIRNPAVFFVFALGGLLATAEAFSKPIAIILSGTTTQGEDLAFTELSVGDILRLGPGEEFEILDYTTCQEFYMRSGEVRATETGLVFAQSEPIRIGLGECHSIQAPSALGNQSASMGMTLRDGRKFRKHLKTVVVKFQDNLSDRYKTVRVSYDGSTPVTHGLNGLLKLDVDEAARKASSITLRLRFVGHANSVHIEDLVLSVSDPSRESKFLLLN